MNQVQQIRSYLQRKGSPLAPYAGIFVEAGSRYGVDPRFLVAISGIETGFGKTGAGLRNPTGYHSARDLGGVRRAVFQQARGLGATQDAPGFKAFYKGARTISQIGPIYSPIGASNDPNGTNNQWVPAVTQFYRELGGDPSKPVRGLTRGQTPPPATTGAPGATAQPATTQSVTLPEVPQLGQFNLAKAMALLGQNTQRSLRGLMPQRQSMESLYQLGLSAMPNLRMRQYDIPVPTRIGPTAIVPPGGQPQAAVPQTRLSRGGAPYQGTHTLGNWQSDLAYDMFGKAGTVVTAPETGVVTKVSPFRSDPRFGGAPVTIRFNDGTSGFFQHLEGVTLKPGQRVQRGTQIGKLWAHINGGPHLHLGATTRSKLESLSRYYTGGAR